MSRIVVSWLAYNKDFDENDRGGVQLNTKGPTITIHKVLYESEGYDTHYLLQCVPERNTPLEKRIKAMTRHLKEFFPSHNVIIKELSLGEDELTNYEKVAAHLREFMQGLSNKDDIDVISGTGSAIMQMAWVALFYSMDLKFELSLLHHNPVKYPDPIPVKLTKSRELDEKLREINLREAPPASLIIDRSLKRIYEKAEIYANAINSSVLILGETGTGKDFLAKHIVKNSPRYDMPYSAINCASLPEDTLLYSELFGHTSGAFTGATGERKGLFLTCKGGTVFLDEIGDISAKLQVSLLRAIEKNEIKPLGSDKVLENVNVRIISATNADLLDKCERGEFRWDLYWRLKECQLKLESFRDRSTKERIHILNSIIKEAEENFGKKLSFSPEAKMIFYNYQYPGNFREIRSTVFSLFVENKRIEVKDLPDIFFRKRREASTLAENEKNHIEKVYRESNYVIAETARRLGLSNQHTLKKKIVSLGIKIPKKD